MKKKILFILCFYIFVKCSFISENKKLSDILENLSIKNRCKITYENSTGTSGEIIKLKINNLIVSEFNVGKIINDFEEKISKEKLFFDNYEFYVNQKLFYIITENDFKIILDKKRRFINEINYVSKNEISTISSNISEQLKKDFINLKVDSILIKNKQNIKKSKFNGFKITNFENEKYIVFQSINGNHKFSLSYKLNKLDTKIYGILVE